MRLNPFQRTLGLLTLALATAAPAQAGAQGPFTFPDGPPNYAGYTTPSQCLAAVYRVRGAAYWGQDRDTLPRSQRAEQLAPVVAETARECGRRLRLSDVSRNDLESMQTLAILMEDDSLLYATVQRRLAQQGTARDSAALLYETASFGLLGRGQAPRLAAARTLVGWLDAMPGSRPEVDFARALAHGVIASHLWRMDDSTWQNDAQVVLEAIRRAPAPQMQLGLLFLAGERLLWMRTLPVLRSQGVDAGLAAVRDALRSLVGEAALEDGPLAAQLAKLGVPAPPITGDFWFGRAPGESITPHPGRVTLVQFVSESCGVSCRSAYATLRRLAHRFGDSLDVVLVAQTQGYVRGHVTSDPSAEAELLRDYYLGFEQLPAVLSVSTTPFKHLPDPDRRRINSRVPNAASYHGVSQALVDKAGRVVFVPHGGTDEKLLAELIEILTRQPAPPTT